ncbi:MAG: DUF1028 domain-containing protein [Rhodothermaceae bacterium]
MLKKIFLPVVILFLATFVSDSSFDKDPFASTFSVVGFDPVTGDLGVAVQSKFPNVRPVVPWAKAGVGAVATQSFAKLEYATHGLKLLEQGYSAEEALKKILKSDKDRQQRQVGIVDAKGNSASWTGTECFGYAGGYTQNDSRYIISNSEKGNGTVITGKYFSVQGNILVSEETTKAMAEAFVSAKGSLAEKLLASLTAGGKAGGDKRGEQSAALLVVRKNAGYDGSDNFIDISVYDHKTPIKELNRLYNLNNLYFTASLPENMISISKKIAKELQLIWQKRGFYSGEINGKVDKKFQKILIDFMGWENYDMRIINVKEVNLDKNEILKIDREVLEDIRKVFKSNSWKMKTN